MTITIIVVIAIIGVLVWIGISKNKKINNSKNNPLNRDEEIPGRSREPSD